MKKSSFLAGSASLTIALSFHSARAEEERPWKVAPTLSIYLHKEQVKDSSGAPSTRLASHRQIGLMTSGTYCVLPWLDVGAFFLAERGSRTLLGGGPTDYALFWTGPTVRGSWRAFFLELSYVLYGIRKDEGLPQIASLSGDTTSAFHSDRAQAWFLGLGATIPLAESLEFYLKFEYRFHYYTQRGDEDLVGGARVGSQTIRPHLGVLWRL